MKARWFFPIAVLLTLRMEASDAAIKSRVATIAINPREVTVLHLRPEFESTIRLPEEVTSVILGSPGEFKAEHNEGEPNYVYVKPITKDAAQSNLLIATKSGQHVSVQLISNGLDAPGKSEPVDFLIEYRVLSAMRSIRTRSTGKLYADLYPGNEISRDNFEEILGAMARADLSWVTVMEQSLCG